MELKQLLTELEQATGLALLDEHGTNSCLLGVNGITVGIKGIHGGAAVEILASPGKAQISNTHLLKDLLSAHAGARSGGAILSIDAELSIDGEHRVTMQLELQLAYLDFATFKSAFEHFLAALQEWQVRLETLGQN